MQDRPSPTGQPDRLDAQALRAALLDPASAGPVSLEVAWSVDSTNAELWRRSPVPGWEILLAEQQTAGRGRLGRSWVSPLSSQVCMSLRGRFAGGLAQLEGLSLVAGVALSEALHRAAERADAERFGYEIVCVRPRPKAGGSFATAVYEAMDDPVAVEFVKADAGLDIGNTMIGMHLKHVAVPLRLSVKTIGEAPVNAARTRPKLIGGSRAEYPD